MQQSVHDLKTLVTDLDALFDKTKGQFNDAEVEHGILKRQTTRKLSQSTEAPPPN